MDSVTPVFCYSVAATMRRPLLGIYPDLLRLRSLKWRNALEKEQREQIRLKVQLSSLQDSKWRCRFIDEFEKFDFLTAEQVEKLPWEKVRIVNFAFYGVRPIDIDLVGTSGEIAIKEVEEIIKRTRGCLYDAVIHLPIAAPEAIERLLPYWIGMRSINEVKFDVLCMEYEDFMLDQLKSENLEYLDIQRRWRWTAELQKATVEYAMRNHYQKIHSPVMECNKARNYVCFTDADRLNEEFLKTLLASGASLHIRVEGTRWSAELPAVIEAHALTKPFKKIECPNMDFTMLFFERLFEEVRVETDETMCFIGKFFAKMANLRNFKKNQQIVIEKFKIEWMREDLVKVTVRSVYSDGLLVIQFEKLE